MSFAFTFAIAGALIAGAFYVAVLVVRFVLGLAGRVVEGFVKGFNDPVTEVEEPSMIPTRSHRGLPSPHSAGAAWSVPGYPSKDEVAACLARVYDAHLEGVAYFPRTDLDQAICEGGTKAEALARVHGGYRFASDYGLAAARWCWERQHGRPVTGHDGAGSRGPGAPSIHIEVHGPVLIHTGQLID